MKKGDRGAGEKTHPRAAPPLYATSNRAAGAINRAPCGLFNRPTDPFRLVEAPRILRERGELQPFAKGSPRWRQSMIWRTDLGHEIGALLPVRNGMP